MLSWSPTMTAPRSMVRRLDLPMNQPRHLSNIQILRGVAASMVLIYHIGNELDDHGLAQSGPLFWTGSAGVDIFFVISGFIMVHSSVGAFAKPGAPGLFLARRAVRLVPLYWLVTTIFVAVEVRTAGGAGLPGQTWRWFAASYAFLFYPHGEGGDFPLYAQGWTLNFEMFFYSCFTAALLLRRPAAIWAMSAGLAALSVLGLVIALPWPVDRWANTNIVEFVLGMALAEVHLRNFRLPLPAVVALAASGFIVFYLSVASVDAWLPYRGFVWGPPALAVVAAAALYRPRREGLVRIALEKLGDASYSLYLVHYAFFVGLAYVFERFAPIAKIPLPLYCTALFAGAIGLAFIVYRFLEQPATRGLNRALGLPRRWRALTTDAPEAI
jgi:exopolysaccharide production protein ExoZ